MNHNLPKNIDNPPIHVKHADLPPNKYGHVLRRPCPECKDGMLLVRRGDDMRLEAFDVCISCGQRFIYDDIAELRKADPIERHYQTQRKT